MGSAGAIGAGGPVRPASAVDEVSDRLLTAVALGDFLPGERLPGERELARLLAVSRSTVHAALGRLRLAGVVETRRGRSGGAFVLASWAAASGAAVQRTLGSRRPELEQLLDLRGLVEGMVARVAAERRTPADIERLREALSAFARAGTPAEEHAADTAIHAAVLAATGNPQIVALSLDLLARVSSGFAIEPYSREVYARALAEHTALVTAVVDGAAEAAGSVARDHFSMTARQLRQVMSRGEPPADDGGQPAGPRPAVSRPPSRQ